MVCIHGLTVNPRFLHRLNHQEADQLEDFHADQVLGQSTGFAR